jgi:DNA-binding NarL/FixJ family response regulator
LIKHAPIPKRNLSVLLLEDHPLLMRGVTAMLDAAGHSVSASRTSVAAALEPGPAYDVAVVDIELPGVSGLEFVREATSRGGACVVFSVHGDANHVREAVRAGALGYVRKTATPEILLEAVERVAEHKSYFCDEAMAVFRDEGTPLKTLSARERQVVQLVCEGLTTKEVAAFLGLSPRTVETHRERLMIKLGVHNVVRLTRVASAAGLLRRTGSPGQRLRGWSD